MKQEHTQLPWSVHAVFPHGKAKRWLINPDVAVCKSEANAFLILRACNNFEALLKAAKDVVGLRDIADVGDFQELEFRCQWCNRHYAPGHFEEETEDTWLCPADDCPGHQLRVVIAQAKKE